MAEEQLNALNAYMAKATHAYQSEIMRLRKEVSSLKAVDKDKDGKRQARVTMLNQAGENVGNRAGKSVRAPSMATKRMGVGLQSELLLQDPLLESPDDGDKQRRR